MAKKKTTTHSRIGKSYTAYSGTIKTNGVRMSSQDISNWVKAINAAINPKNPKRALLYDLYDNIKVDGHLESVMDKRTNAVINKKLIFTEKGKDGQVNEFMKDQILDTPWMRKLLKLIMSSVSFGHALIELVIKDGMISDVELIPRKNVVPETGFLIQDISVPDKGTFYRDEAFEYHNYLIEAGDTKTYGKLMNAAQYIIYKRGAFGDWAQFAEMFGSPFRVGKYNKYDDDVRAKLENALEEMGTAPYAVIPEGASVEFHDNNSAGKSEVFKDLIDICNKEISKLYVGQTMTTEDGSSKSQSETHKEVEEEINYSDMIEVEFLLNWQFLPKIRNIGYPIPEGKITFDQTKALPIEKRIEIDLKVSEKIFYPDAYWYKTYGVPKPDAKELAEKLKKQEEVAEKKKIDYNLNPQPQNIFSETPLVNTYELTDEDEQYINDFYNKKVTFSKGAFTATLDKLKKAVRDQFDVKSSYLQPDYIAGTMMEINLNQFGFNKYVAQVYELNKALDIDESYATFRKKAIAILGKFDAYLEIEYNTAIAKAQNAASYIRQYKDKQTFPYWRYDTMEDEQVRASHEALNGKTFSIDDVKARSLTPPLEFGCRCTRTALRKDQVKKNEVITFDKASKILGDDIKKMKENGFLNNPGETLEIFDLNTHYIDQISNNENLQASNINFSHYGLKTISELRDTNSYKSLKRDPKATRKTILSTFDKNKKVIDNKEVVLYKDFSSREVALEKNILEKNLVNEYLTKGYERDKIFGNLKEVLNSPDEVYLRKYKSTLQYTYVKVYDQDVMIVIVTIDKKTGMKIKSWYKNTQTEKSIRKGILIKNE
ncbi:DUF935 family protein [Tenacibaculum maritimum]|uniref:phage portal protein family protein n=1 Tax=Tenacibaculum maritimum TaxID=107401 RepID=UPI003876FF78